jgi:hypothetical protein
LPSIENPTGVTDRDELQTQIEASIAEGYE